MNSVKIEKQKLLEILKKNRADHRSVFIKAQDKYREVAIKEMDKQLKAARDGESFVLSRFTELSAPRDYTAEYDRTIKMLEMSVDEVIVVSSQEFSCFVEDKWHWTRDWAVSNSRYTSSPKMSAALRDEE